jgi:hypothetical protein
VIRDRRRAPRPRTAADDRAAVVERKTRSLEEPLDVQLRSTEPFRLLEVRNPLHGTRYLVMLPTFPSRDAALCTCTDFARRGLGTCKHLEAAVRWQTRHPDAPPTGPAPPRRSTGPLWKAIELAVAREPAGAAPESARWRRAGALLFAERSER